MPGSLFIDLLCDHVCKLKQSFYVLQTLWIGLQGLYALGEVAIEDLVPDIDDDRHAYVQHLVKPVSVGQEVVPEVHHFINLELLAHEQHNPALGVILRLHIHALELIVYGAVNDSEHTEESLTLVVHPAAPLPQRPAAALVGVGGVARCRRLLREAIPQLLHQVAEAEEDIRFELLTRGEGFLSGPVLPETEVDHSQHLVHPPHVLDMIGVDLRVNE